MAIDSLGMRAGICRKHPSITRAREIRKTAGSQLGLISRATVLAGRIIEEIRSTTQALGEEYYYRNCT
jgi:hypothetical protein